MKFLISITVFALIFQATSSMASEGRRPYIEGIYKSLPTILVQLAYGESGLSNEAKDFAQKLYELTVESESQLIFVNDSSQFELDEQNRPRLMRAPDEPGSPVFVNEVLLNSSEFDLNLVQVFKILCHEIGHKTQLSDVDQRDIWAQEFENELAPQLVTHQEDDKKIEALSLRDHLVEVAVDDHPIRVQPTFWVYSHSDQGIEDLSQSILDDIQENSLLARSITNEIQTVITEVATFFKEKLFSPLAPVFDGLLNAFSGPSGPPNGGFGGMMGKQAPGLTQAMTLLEISRISLYEGNISLDGKVVHTRSHRNTLAFNVSGLPWEESQKTPIQIRFGKNKGFQFLPESDFESSVKPRGIVRESNTIKSFNLVFEHDDMPFGVEIILQNENGTIRVPAKDREDMGNGKYKAIFELTNQQRQHFAIADRIIVDNDSVKYLDRKLVINENPQPHDMPQLTEADIIPDSMGVWGMRGQEWVMEKEFSHLQTAIVFIMPVPGNEQFVINPYSLWVEFEIREDLDIEYAEMYWSLEQLLSDISEGDHNVARLNEEINGKTVEQRYVGSGTMKERNTLRESIFFSTDVIETHPGSKPGFKKIRMKTIMPMKHLRELREPTEAHYPPQATPMSIRVMTTDHQSYYHNFPSKFSDDMIKNEIRRGCGQMLDSSGNSPQN